MKAFPVPTREQVNEKAQAHFDQYTRLIGHMPNLYAAIGYSGNELDAYLAFVQAQARGTFHGKEREAVYLIVSELNGCEYCLASHTQSAMKMGWKLEETVQLRAGLYENGPWPVLYKVIRSIIDNRGSVADELLDAFTAAGYSPAALVDLLGLVSVMSFTNYAYRLLQVPVDFPPAPPLA